MNPNIKKISSEILSTNFSWLDAGYIKDLGVMEQQPSIQEGDTEVLRITYDGKYVLNRSADSEIYVKFLQSVMNLKDTDLNNTKGFYKVMRSLLPGVLHGRPEVVIAGILKQNGIFEQNVTLFKVLSEWEQARRTVKRQYKKQKTPGLLPRFIKGR